MGKMLHRIRTTIERIEQKLLKFTSPFVYILVSVIAFSIVFMLFFDYLNAYCYKTLSVKYFNYFLTAFHVGVRLVAIIITIAAFAILIQAPMWILRTLLDYFIYVYEKRNGM